MDKSSLELTCFEQPGIFLAANRQPYEGCRVALLGLPMDYTTSYRGGARWGPDAIRQASAALETFSLRLRRGLEEIAFYDCGNLGLPVGNTDSSLQCLRKTAHQVAADGKLPVFLGGEHLISAATIESMIEFYPNLLVIQFDAHADLRENYLGEKHSHATAMRLAAQAIGPQNIFQFGVRSATAQELAYSEAAGTHLYPLCFSGGNIPVESTGSNSSSLISDIKQVLSSGVWNNRPVYITIDIDVVDPAFAPGTGTPEPGGCTSAEILEAIYLLRDLQVVALDLVEVSPEVDLSQRTAMLAAKLLREAILLWAWPKVSAPNNYR